MAQSTITDIGTLDAQTVFPGKPPGYSLPYAGRNFPSRVFWGDTHLHTSASMDAGAFGTRLGFEDAYRFARGEELTASGGERVKLSRPLDFLVIADHSDNMGFFPALFAGKPEMLADPTGRRWYDMVQEGGEEASRRRSRSSTASRAARFRRRCSSCRAPTATARPGSRSSPRRKNTTSRAASPPSSATSGPRRCRPATICTVS